MDGASGSTHFLAVFACFPRSDAKDGYERALLSFAPLLDEEHLNADSHNQSIYKILQFYEKDYSNVACIIGDNCSINVSLAKKACVFFIGCASHRLNLGVKLIIE